MATKRLTIGRFFDSNYDDNSGTVKAFVTDGIVQVTRAPTADDDVVRKSDIAPVLGTYVTVDDESAGLTQSRQIAEGTGISLTDNGAGNTLVVATNDGEIDHDSLQNFIAEEHIRWDQTGAEDVHDDRISESSVTQHEQALDSFPRRVSQSATPTPASGELMIHHDTDDGKVYLVYNDPSVGVKTVELT